MGFSESGHRKGERFWLVTRGDDLAGFHAKTGERATRENEGEGN